MAHLAAGVELAGRFRLQRLLGRGGSAEVWAAHDSTTGIDVALRILGTPDEVTAASRAAGLQADADRVGSMAHPGIVRPLVVVTDGCLACVALELADGGDLGTLRGTSHQSIVTAAREVADALQYVHAQGLTHGDLKAGNVLRDQQGRWRLTDFRPENRQATVSLSTVSPQQLAGAAPTAADDIYSLGALLFDLLAGHPPFHPDITPERIRVEIPERPAVDGQGQAIPVALTQLVAAMLEKTPARRPGSIGSVRALLAEIAGDAARPPARPVRTVQESGAETARPARRQPQVSLAGRLRVLVVVGLLILLAGVLAVVFWLPRVVSERGPLVAPARQSPAPQPATPVAATTPPGPDQRTSADAALAERMRAEDAAKQSGADRWGGADWLEARRLAELGDTQYRDRDFPGATTSYVQATGRFRLLADGGPAAFAAALQAGSDAIERAEQPAAVAAFERALLIRPGEPAATKGLARSQQLDKVLSAMAEGTARESAGDTAGARAAYSRALEIDANWTQARAAVARIDAGISASEFERAMAQGLSALAAGRTAEARTALNRALGHRPGDAGARSALEQLDDDERHGQLTSLQTEADRLAAAEHWAEAADQYRALLKLDGTVAGAQSGLARADARADLHRRLEEQLANGDHFNDDKQVALAQSVVRDAEAVTGKGPVLTGQITQLKSLLAVAALPVPVRLESDNLTSVVIYRVGALGVFTSRTVELRPGTYVIVGTRDGYRDVRRTVRIGADSGQEPISVRCEESI